MVEKWAEKWAASAVALKVGKLVLTKAASTVEMSVVETAHEWVVN